MPLLSEAERQFAGAVARLAYCNPFLPERIEYERQALGRDFVAGGPVWHAGTEPADSPNLVRLAARVLALAEQVRERLPGRPRAGAEEVALYEALVAYHLYARHEDDFYQLVTGATASTARVAFYAKFLRDFERLLAPARGGAPLDDAPHVFACFFQVRRAFHHIFRTILGGSLPAGRLRAAVWQSIFTRDMARYRRSLYQRMGDVATLVSGASGTGKELVARAIGLARYIPFDPVRTAFVEDFAGSFYALNPSALSPTLIESELFGHRRGAFTGAIADRTGWLEVCPTLGTVFLDEIGELDVAIQVKLLRVLQSRTFQRLGDTRDRRFAGKLIAATNRDLAAEIQAGRFRADLYYRLCADLIETPSLAEQLADSPQERRALVRFLAQRIAGEPEADRLADETEQWIDAHLGPDYAWPGNVRELEQCVRNVMIRGEYRPPRPRAPKEATDDVTAAMLSGSLTADELLRRYCTLVYARTGSYLETARRLAIDRRTVRAKIDRALLERLRREGVTATTG
jgi:transcriptional regulator with AAA-type ATPase domain